MGEGLVGEIGTKKVVLPCRGNENVLHRNPYKGCWRSGSVTVLEYFLLAHAVKRTPSRER